MIREAFGRETKVTILARYPASFADVDATIVDSRMTSGFINRALIAQLLRFQDFDVLIGVGGGYLRFGTAVESVKTVLAHGPQLVAAGLSRVPSVYLPQSIGPYHWVPIGVLRPLFRKLGTMFLRDDRSMEQSQLENSIRIPDLALLATNYSLRDERVHAATPVLSVRKVRGGLLDSLATLASQIDEFDGYVQSRGAGNDDEEAVAAIRPTRILERDEFLSPNGPRRIVIAVRLHAALMAIQAGHWVIHLAYERKGFGAFNDLGLSEYVHNVNSFDPEKVLQQMEQLLKDEHARKRYDESVRMAAMAHSEDRQVVISVLRESI
jgi:polysaccharide pyruvyl transferase WcaK-like protein